ncbi:hypothetical protein [Methylovirgula ligni]|nr:hypothetical protein [Methylovirgula ligni]
MSQKENNDENIEYASPACLLHEVDPAYSGLENAGHLEESHLK